MLSKGTTTRATLFPGSGGKVKTSVNGDTEYDARTTRRAAYLTLGEKAPSFGELLLEQHVDAPIGGGFGSSAAAAVSAVYATSDVLGMRASKAELALLAHRAEILEETGLGTVSVIYDKTGAGAIAKAGVPGEEAFTRVRVPKDLVIVTAFLGPYDKKWAFSSKSVRDRICRLGDDALAAFLSDPSLETLADEGEGFSRSVGLESPEVKRLEAAAKRAGASYASQNMIGYSVHAVARLDTAERVARALGESGARVDTFRVGPKKAGVTGPSRR